MMHKKEVFFKPKISRLLRFSGITGSKPIFYIFVFLILISIACNLSGSNATDAPQPQAPQPEALENLGG